MPTVIMSNVVGKGYGAFWRSRKRYRVVKGGKASKKSSTTALWYISHMMMPEYSKANLLVVRGYMNTHQTSTYAQLKWAINQLGVADEWQCTKSPLEIRLKRTGQKIMFKGIYDAERLASTTVDVGYLCWVWVEEAFEIASERDFDLLDLSAPRGSVPQPLFKQTTLTFNPWSDKSWLKKRFFDNPASNVDAFTTNYLCNEWLDETDLEIYNEMKKNSPRKYAVAGLGEWGISEGLIYENWEVRPFSVDEIMNGENGHLYRCIYGLDYGYSNDPTAFIAAAASPKEKMLYVFDEHYEKRMLNSDIAAMILRKGYSKERIRADSAEPKSNEDLRRLGISRVQAAEKGRDSIIHGIEQLQNYKIVVHPCCPNTIAELSAYVWDTKNDSPVNKPVDRDNHLMDALRYAIQDVKHFKSSKHEKARNNYRKGVFSADGMSGGLSSADFGGGWA